MSNLTQTKPTENYVTEGSRFAGAAWLQRQLDYDKRQRKLSPFGAQVADILGEVYRGLYHLPQSSRHQWEHPHYMKIPVRSVATFDNSDLSHLVILCHDRCVRLEITPGGAGQINLCFSKRDRNAECSFDRHPTLEEQIEKFRIPLGENK